MPYLQANTNNPFGFQPVEMAGQLASVHQYLVSTSQGAGVNSNFAIMPGDIVVQSLGTEGFVTAAASGGLSVAGTGTFTVIGVAAHSVVATPSAVTPVLVYDDPDQIFVVLDNGAATAGLGSTAAFGLTYTFIATATGGLSNNTGNAVRSAMLLAASAGSTARTNPLVLLAMHPIEFIPNAAASVNFATASGIFRKWLVKLNGHLYQTAAGAV